LACAGDYFEGAIVTDIAYRNEHATGERYGVGVPLLMIELVAPS